LPVKVQAKSQELKAEMQDIPKIVRQQLKASTTAMVESHPDADLLTAFAEHAITGAERASVVEHLASCGDCRDVVALALPATETVVIPATRSAWAGGLSLPVLRWGVVAAGLLAVTLVGVQQYKRHHPEQIVASNVIQTKGTTDAAARNAQAIPQVSAPVDSRPSVPQNDMPKQAMAALSVQAHRAFVSSSSDGGEVQSEATHATEQTTAQNQVQDQLIQNQKQRPLDGSNVSNVDTVAKAKDPVPTAASVSPRWTISAAGTLQRSLDDGKTWQNINPGAAVENVAASVNPVPVFRAVAAAGPEVWAGGSAGVLYHTVDGGSGWTLVLPSAAGAILTGDITSIQFPDSQHGTVATSTTEVWITADDGQTWHKR